MAKPKRVAGGEPSTDLVHSACVGTNADLFPHVLRLHVPAGATVADVTFGPGVFWRNVPAGAYRVLASDFDAAPRDDSRVPVRGGVDCRELPYDDASVDCVVLDP